MREPKAPEVERNKGIIPENWELTRTPSGSSETESEEEDDRSRYDRSRYDDRPNGTKGNKHSMHKQLYYSSEMYKYR